GRAPVFGEPVGVVDVDVERSWAGGWMLAVCERDRQVVAVREGVSAAPFPAALAPRACACNRSGPTLAATLGCLVTSTPIRKTVLDELPRARARPQTPSQLFAFMVKIRPIEAGLLHAKIECPFDSTQTGN